MSSRDYLDVECPNCGEYISYQCSWIGEGDFWTEEEAPPSVLGDTDGAIFHCQKCDTWFESDVTVKIKKRKFTKKEIKLIIKKGYLVWESELKEEEE